jgi:putative holliday junction resolvase
MSGRILGVDPGDERIGIAVSDPTGTIARPLTVVKHVARALDAAAIAQLAVENEAVKIVVGQPLDSEGEVGPAGRKSARLAEAIQLQIRLPVELWDESGSTQIAREAQIAMGRPKQKRKGHFDDLAAVVILQSYLEAHRGDEC